PARRAPCAAGPPPTPSASPRETARENPAGAPPSSGRAHAKGAAPHSPPAPPLRRPPAAARPAAIPVPASHLLAPSPPAPPPAPFRRRTARDAFRPHGSFVPTADSGLRRRSSPAVRRFTPGFPFSASPSAPPG